MPVGPWRNWQTRPLVRRPRELGMATQTAARNGVRVRVPVGRLSLAPAGACRHVSLKNCDSVQVIVFSS